MRLETLSIFATFAAGGLQLVAADDASEYRERPRYLARNIKRTVTDVTYDKSEESSLESRNTGGGIASLLNGLGDAVGDNSAEPTSTSSKKNGKEVVVVVSQDREGHLHTLTTSTRMGAEPTDTAVTSTVDDSSPAPVPATPSSTPASTTDDSKKGLDVAGGLNDLLGGKSDSKTDSKTGASSSAPESPSSAPATSTKDSNKLLNVDADVNGLLGGSSDSTTATGSSAPSTPAAATTQDSKKLLDVDADVNGLLGGSSDSTTATGSAPSTPAAATTKDSNKLLDVDADVKGLLGGSSDSTTATGSAPSTPAAAATTKDSNKLLNVDADVNGLLGGKSDSTTATGSSAPVISTPAASTTDSKNPLDLGDDLKNLGKGVSNVLNPDSNTTSGSSTPLTAGSPSAPSPTDKNLLEHLLGDKSTSSSATNIPVSVPVSPSATPSSSFDPVGDLTNGVSGLLNGSSNAQPLVPTPSSPLSIPKPINSVGGVPSASIPLSGSPTNLVGFVPVPHAPSTGPSDRPVGSDSGASGSVPIPTGPAQESSKVIPAASSTPLPQSTEPVTTSIVAPQTTSTSRPSSTESDWMPSSILILPTRPVSESTSTNTNTQGEATSLPGSITPNDASEPPENSMLLQLGFDGSLPWSFVATTPLSTSQIFQYVPKALAYAVPKFGSGATMYALQPYFNWKQTGYNATIAVFYFPRDGLDALKKLHSNPNSALYKDHDNQAVSTLMTMIDPTIPLVYNGNVPSEDDGSDSSGNGNDDGGDDNNGNNVDGGSGSSGTGKASAAGIATGAVAGAAAYGAAMFWVARRYRKRRQLHQRASSTGDAMSQNSAAASAAGAGSQRTARSQMISAPVMAENSLGWN